MWLEKGYITVIRSMWHILPYDQLLELLETDEKTLAILLREEDFLDIKLSKKPVCEPVRMRPLTDEERERTALIKQVVESADEGGVPAFGFKFIKPDIKFEGKELVGTRMIYLFSGLYQTAFDVPSETYCSDEMLESYKALGVNAVWTQGILYLLTEFPFDPSLSAGWEKRQKNLRDFTERLDRYGIKLILYLNEPRCMPESFFEKYPDLKGDGEGDKVSMCTSVPRVREYITASLKSLCAAAPLLGGFFTITRSENKTNCYSHTRPQSCGCPRCKKRGVGEVIGELLGAMRDGIDPDKKLIAWSWGWNEFNLDVIRHLPENVILQSQSELNVPTNVGGVKNEVHDYSMGQIGPGERAMEEWALAQSLGHETMAKVQVNTSWEGSTVPAIPVFPLVEEHIRRIREKGVKHFQLSWTLGGYPSANLMHVAKFYNEKVTIPEESEAEKRACALFSEAFKEFPFDIHVLYKGPHNGGPSNPLYAEPTGYKATMTCYAYDDLTAWRDKYPEDVFENQFAKMCALWEKGLCELEGEPETETVIMARAGYCIYRSSLDQVRFYRARERGDRAAMKALAASEEKTARDMLALMDKNAAIGFEAANHYYFSKRMITEKILNCTYLQKTL